MVCLQSLIHVHGAPYSQLTISLSPEPFNDDGTFRQDVFFNTLGESYIATALRTAKAADPNAKVYINDFNIEGTGNCMTHHTGNWG